MRVQISKPRKARCPILILTRRVNESIDIGNGARVTVTSIGAGRVRLGVDAPGVRVKRSELPPLSGAGAGATNGRQNPLESGGVGR